MFRSNSSLSNKLNVYDPSLLTPPCLNRSISNLHDILTHKNKSPNPQCGNSSFGLVNDFLLRHRQRELSQRNFLTNQSRLKMIQSVNNFFSEKLPRLEQSIKEEKMYTKDDYVYDKIFLKVFKNRNNKEIIDNKLNLFYAENEEQFEKNLKKMNNELYLKGEAIKHNNIKCTYIEDKIKEIKDKITFMKGVSYYSFPSIILKRIEEANKLYKEERNLKRKIHLPPYEIVNKIHNERNISRMNLLKPAINVTVIKKNSNLTQMRYN